MKSNQHKQVEDKTGDLKIYIIVLFDHLNTIKIIIIFFNFNFSKSSTDNKNKK